MESINPTLNEFFGICDRLLDTSYKPLKDNRATNQEGIWRELRWLPKHNDRDFGDCCLVVSYILWMQKEQVVFNESEKNALIKAIQCILSYQHLHKEVLLSLLKSRLLAADYEFLQEFDALDCFKNINEQVNFVSVSAEELGSIL